MSESDTTFCRGGSNVLNTHIPPETARAFGDPINLNVTRRDHVSQQLLRRGFMFWPWDLGHCYHVGAHWGPSNRGQVLGTSASYLGGPRFKYRPEDQLS